MKIFYSCITFLLLNYVCSAAGAYFGTVSFADGGKPAEGATARLLDSAKVQKYHSITDKKGNFVFNDVKNGKYTLRITYVGYKSIEFGYTITNTSKKNLGTFALEVSEKQTETVNVTADAILGEMVGDTAQFNAGAFKVDSTGKAADLLKKIPGVEVDAQGNVKAQGKEVEKVLVDGRTFFSDDPKTALENIPAKSVDKVQVYDKASDQDEFLGKDVDKDKKAINITLKKDAKRGVFGHATAGAGTRSRYAGNLFANIMNGSSRSTLLGWINNTNENGVDFSSLFTSGAGISMFSQIFDFDPDNASEFGSEMDVFGSGIFAKTSAIGFATANDYGIFKKTNLMYFFKKRKTESRTETKKEYIPKTETSEISESNDYGSNEKYYHTFTAKSDQIDLSKHSAMKLNFTGGYNKPKSGATSTDYTNYQNGTAVSSSNSKETSETTQKDLSLDLSYRYKFDKKGRTFGIKYGLDYSDADGTGEQNSLVKYMLAGKSDTILQHNDIYSKDVSNTIHMSGSEPFAKYSQISYDYDFGIKNNTNNKYAYNRLAANALDTSLSNKYKNTQTSHDAGVDYRFKKDKFTINAGVDYQNISLDGKNTFPQNYKVNYTVGKFLPKASINYKLIDSQQDWGNDIEISYSNDMTAPRVDQLRAVLDNSNPLWLSIGNPNLKASTASHYQFDLNLQSPDFKKIMWLRCYYANTSNSVSDNIFTAKSDTVIDGIALFPGSHLTRLVNLDGGKDLEISPGFQLPLLLLHGWNWNLNGNYNYTEDPAMIDNTVYHSKNTSLGCTIGISSPYSENFEFNINGGFTYNRDKNSSMGDSWRNEYRQYDLSGGIRWTFYKTAYFRLNSDNTFYSGSFYRNGDYNTNLLAGIIGADFLKGKALKAELQFTDMLHDRKSLKNITAADYMMFRKKAVLQSYIMLRLTYNFNTMGGKSMMPDGPQTIIIDG